MFLVSTTWTTNQMSEKYAGYDTETYLLRKTSKDRLSLPVVNLDKASVCGDRKTSFSFWKKRKLEIHKYRGFLLPRREGVKGGAISGVLCQILGVLCQIGRDHMYAYSSSFYPYSSRFYPYCSRFYPPLLSCQVQQQFPQALYIYHSCTQWF